MLHHTRGMVIRTVKFSETSLIAKIYTEKLGLQTYMVNGVRSKKSRTKAALLQPLSLLEMEVYHRENKNMQRVKEMKPAHLFTSIPFELVKISLALFITEVLYKTLKEETGNADLFTFLYDFVRRLDQSSQPDAELHLRFMLAYSKHLGFQPQNNFDEQIAPLFDLKEGHFVPSQPPKFDRHLELPHSHNLSQLLNRSKQRINKVQREAILVALIKFYQYHIDGFGELKSHKILQQIMQ